LYPILINDSRPYLFIGICSSILGATALLCALFIIKYAPPYWNLIISILYGVYFWGWVYYIIYDSGLYGFNIAVFIYNIFKKCCIYNKESEK